MKDKEVIEIRVDEQPAIIQAEAHVLFRILRALAEDGRDVEVKERGNWRNLNSPLRKAA